VCVCVGIIDSLVRAGHLDGYRDRSKDDKKKKINQTYASYNIINIMDFIRSADIVKPMAIGFLNDRLYTYTLY
jgi:hypothetical protein